MEKKHVSIGLLIVALIILAYFFVPEIASTKYKKENDLLEKDNVLLDDQAQIDTKPETLHLKTPDSVRAVYMTSWVAATPSLRDKVIKLIDDTEINSVVIDIKDYTGRISFDVGDEYLATIGSPEKRISNIRELIETLHEKDIYVIGRISAFQDQYLINKWPEFGVKKASDKNTLWRDRKNIGWFDAGSKEVWDYLVHIGEVSYDVGFDELNFDYIRFPSDGNMKDIYYPVSEGAIKHEVLREFFAYIDNAFKDSEVVLSADLFGMTTTNNDDLGIGQILEDALIYFDFVCPMVYPSHYPKGFNGYSDVNKYPYEIIKFSMDGAIKKVNNLNTQFEIFKNQTIIDNQNNLSTESKKIIFPEYFSPISIDKIRPWLQDNNYPVTYTKEMVRAQIDATYASGLDSWMLWDPANTYTEGALLIK